MDMNEVEHLNNEELVEAIINDIRSAADGDYSCSTTGPLKSVLLSERKSTNTNDPEYSLNSSLHSETTSTDSRTSASTSENLTSYCLIRDDSNPQITAL